MGSSDILFTKAIIFATFIPIYINFITKIVESFKEDSSPFNLSNWSTVCSPLNLNKIIKRNDSFCSVKTQMKKLKLISKKIDLNEAATKLHISTDNHKFTFCLHQSIPHIYYIYNETEDTTLTDKCCEFIVMKNKTRPFLAVYRILPFSNECGLGYTSYHIHDFFQEYNFEKLLENKYNRDRAARVIQKGCRNWIFKGQTHDGRMGINCRLSVQDLKNRIGAY